MGFGAVVGAVGAGLSPVMDMVNANQAHHWAQDDARTAFEQSMAASNTAHQREVADLKAAGLNPVLSANAGASSPTATVASQPSRPNFDFVGSAVALRKLEQDIKESDSRIDVNKAEADVKRGGYGARLLGTDFFSKGKQMIDSVMKSGVNAVNSARGIRLGDYAPFDSEANKRVLSDRKRKNIQDFDFGDLFKK